MVGFGEGEEWGGGLLAGKARVGFDDIVIVREGGFGSIDGLFG